MPKLVAKIVIENFKGEILLLLRGKTAPGRPLTWDLPGGIIDEGEKVDEGAHRELKEETGIVAENLRFVYKRPKSWGYTWHLYYDKLDDPTVTISWEHEDKRWVKIEDLPDISDLPDFYLKEINDVLKGIKD